jgi:hypothetical protein
MVDDRPILCCSNPENLRLSGFGAFGFYRTTNNPLRSTDFPTGAPNAARTTIHFSRSVRADEKLTAFIELERVTYIHRWKRLAEQQGVAYAKTVAQAMNLKLDADNPADREKLRRAILDLVAGRKMPKQKHS